MFLLNNKVQTGGYKTFLHFPECSLSFAEIVQESAMRACSLIAERSLSYAKTMQMSGKNARFCFPECSLSYAKIVQRSFRQNKTLCFWPFPTLASLH